MIIFFVDWLMYSIYEIMGFEVIYFLEIDKIIIKNM